MPLSTVAEVSPVAGEVRRDSSITGFGEEVAAFFFKLAGLVKKLGMVERRENVIGPSRGRSLGGKRNGS